MIENSSIETLKQQLDIVDVVGYYFELKKSGSSYKCLCPFHDDTSPSLHVSPAKQIYHCFVCGAGGDAIKFVMEHERLSYPEAIEKLATMYNFSLTYTKDDGKTYEQKKVLEILNKEYQKCLDKNANAKNYLHERGIYASSIEKFEIGYAPQSNYTLSLLSQSGVTIAEAKEYGVADVGENGRAYARFIERITFPILSSNGKIVGFGGRTISNHPAKYVNSPQTKLFNKSRLLYGYHEAKTDILKKNSIIITEGYLDVIMLHQAGFTNAVATLGTALTSEHLPLIARSNPKVILAYDGDEAGVMAALKASRLLSLNMVDGGVVLFGGGADPADMVQSGKSDELAKLFRSPKPFVEFCIEKIAHQFDFNNPIQKQEALEQVKSYLKSLPNTIASAYLGIVASLFNIKESLLHVNTHQAKIVSKTPREFKDFQELTIIKTLLEEPHLIDTVLDTIDPALFKTHQEELSMLLANKLDSPILRRVLLWDDVKTFDEQELREALLDLMTIYYQEELQKVKKMKNLDYNNKIFLIRKIQDILIRLKKGELVSHESFSTI